MSTHTKDAMVQRIENLLTELRLPSIRSRFRRTGLSLPPVRIGSHVTARPTPSAYDSPASPGARSRSAPRRRCSTT